MCGIPHRIVSVICNPFKLGFQYVSSIFLQFDCVVVTTQYKNKTAIRTSDCDLGIKVALQTASAKHTESFVSSLVQCLYTWLRLLLSCYNPLISVSLKMCLWRNSDRAVYC